MGRGGQISQYRLSGRSGRVIAVSGLCLVLLAGYLVTRALSGEASDEAAPLGSSGGCFFAPETCRGAAGGATSGAAPTDTTATADALAGAASGGPAATRSPTPSARAATPAHGATRARKPRVTKAPPARRLPPVPVPVVEYSFSGRWDDGYVVILRFTNTTRSTWDGWQLVFAPGDGSRIFSSWNARVLGRQGRVRAVDEGWNGVLRPGEQVRFGLEGAGGFQPSGCELNGRTCRFSQRDNRR